MHCVCPLHCAYFVAWHPRGSRCLKNRREEEAIFAATAPLRQKNKAME